MPGPPNGHTASRCQLMGSSCAPAARQAVQQRYHVLGAWFKAGRAAANSRAAPLKACSSQNASTTRRRHERQPYGVVHSKARQLAPVRVFKAVAPYDLDDYEWDDQQLAAFPSTQGLHTSSSTSHQQTHQQHQQQQQQPAAAHTHADDFAGDGIVGLFVGGWMILIAAVLKVLQPIGALLWFATRPLRRWNLALAQHSLKRLAAELPEGWWAKLTFMWERPVVKSIRITLSVANWSVRLPVLLTVLLTQGSLLASQVSLPMLAPLLLGTGMMMNSIKANASYIIPRLGLLVVLMWMLWFVNSVLQTTWIVLRNQGRIDPRTMSGARMITECTSLLLAGIVVLSMLGINVNALLLPTGVVLAIASKDLLQNLIAGFYLVLVQPFRLGDKVAVTCNLPTQHNSLSTATAVNPSQQLSSSTGGGAGGGVQGWFEGVCEKVDLRYTVLRDGRRRLMVPNTAFVSREFLVYDDGVPDAHGRGYSSIAAERSSGSSEARTHTSTQPVIREGHPTTEMPPLAAPIFPGLWQQAGAYPHQYSHHSQYSQHSQQYAAYFAAQPLQSLDQQQQLTEHHEQQQDALPQQQQESAPQQQQQQQQPLSPSGGRGPPGYMPQGFNAPGMQYVGIPVYYGLPGMAGTWGEGTAANSLQQARQRQQQQESPGMHQPVAPYQPEGVHNQPGPWNQQQHQQHQSLGQSQQQQGKDAPQQVQQHHADKDWTGGSSSSYSTGVSAHDQQQQQGSSQRIDGSAGLSTRLASASQQEQQHHVTASHAMQQQASRAASLSSVAGCGYWSYDGLQLSKPMAAVQSKTTTTRQPIRSHNTRMSAQHWHPDAANAIRPLTQAPAATAAAAAAESPLPQGTAEPTDISIGSGLANFKMLPVTGVVSAVAAATAQFPGPADAAAVAEASAQIVAAGEQAVQAVQPLMRMWQDIGLEQF